MRVCVDLEFGAFEYVGSGRVFALGCVFVPCGLGEELVTPIC